MSNERIDDILEETIPFFRANEDRNPHYAGLIRKAMQQYGAEQYQKGRMDQEKVELFKLELQAQEAIRLRELVEAQKAYIELLEPDAVFRSNWTEGIELRHKIKELEA